MNKEIGNIDFKTNEVSLKDDIGSMKGADLIADINKTQKVDSGLEEPEGTAKIVKE